MSSSDPLQQRELVAVVERRDSPMHGSGLFATRTVAEGEVLLAERPLISMKLTGDGACSRCLRAAVSPAASFARTANRILAEAEAEADECDDDDGGGESGESSSRSAATSGLATLEPITEAANTFTGSKQTTHPCECEGGCGELYCCPKCRAADSNAGGHSLLCGAAGAAIRHFAEEHNHVFLLGAKAMAAVLAAHHAGGAGASQSLLDAIQDCHARCVTWAHLLHRCFHGNALRK
jgi:hypothetical protein